MKRPDMLILIAIWEFLFAMRGLIIIYLRKTDIKEYFNPTSE